MAKKFDNAVKKALSKIKIKGLKKKTESGKGIKYYSHQKSMYDI